MSDAEIEGADRIGPLWSVQDAAGRRALLTDILAQVSREALQGEGLEAVLQGIVNCLVRQLPVAIASIILLDEAGTHFVQEVVAGDLELDSPADGRDWPVSVGAAGRCAREALPQLITDVDSDPDYVAGHEAVRSEYLVPIRHRERMHGVLNIESTQRDFFSTEVRAVFDAVAAQVAGAIHLARVVQELEIANRKLQRLSMSDGLTGIANRRCFDERLAAEWERAVRGRTPLALLLVDADCFKPLNDAHGHLYGDECLRELARLCSEAADAPHDVVARYGGEEIALLLPGRDPDAARAAAERVRASVDAAALAHANSTVASHVTVSVGVAVLQPRQGQSPEALVALADRALYTAKAGGRNQVQAC